MIKRLKKTGGHEVENPYLTDAILKFSDIVKSLSGKYQDSLIADFLHEQNLLGDKTITTDAIKMMRHRQNKSKKVIPDTTKMNLIWDLIVFPHEVQAHPNPEQDLPPDLLEIMLSLLK